MSVQRFLTRALGASVLANLILPAALAEGPGRPTLLLSQAQFEKSVDQSGKQRVRPGAARLVMVRLEDGGWKSAGVIEDPESNVFHKAVVWTNPAKPEAGPGVLTIGANAALCRFWTRAGEQWTAETLWQTKYGGKQDRLRDFEINDVDGDGKPEIVIATHDQGVIEVLTLRDGKWTQAEIDRRPNTWVHEIEIGDLDGDGKNEIYATPSEPNRLDGTPQPGWITVYRSTGEGFQREVVEELLHRHVKEILVADLKDGAGPVLFAAKEAELGKREGQPPKSDNVAIFRYTCKDGKYEGQVIAYLPDKLTRFLNAADVNGDGKPELIASTLRSGIWMLTPGSGGEWKSELIEKDSSGFEHATLLADLDGDGTSEIYVAADDQHSLRCYRWKNGKWEAQELGPIEDDKITFNLQVGPL